MQKKKVATKKVAKTVAPKVVARFKTTATPKACANCKELERQVLNFQIRNEGLEDALAEMKAKKDKYKKKCRKAGL